MELSKTAAEVAYGDIFARASAFGLKTIYAITNEDIATEPHGMHV